jgi:MFS family permease
MLCAAAIIAVFCLRLYAALQGWPDTFIDEIFYVSPAENWWRTGTLGIPALASQLAVDGVPSAKDHYFLTLPTALAFRTAFLGIFGIDLVGRRLADLAIGVGVGFVLYRTSLRYLGTRTDGLVACAFFVVNSTVFWFWAGRPDLLGLAFGLSAAMAWKQSENLPRRWRSLFGAGILIGASGLCHPFAGFFWLVFLVMIEMVTKGWKASILLILWVGSGAMCIVLIWLLPTLALHHSAFLEQSAWMVRVKQGLPRDWMFAVEGFLVSTFGRMPLAAPLLILLFWKRYRNGHDHVCYAAALTLVLMLAYWAVSFEPTNRSYMVHFWALLSICLALGVDSLSREAERQKGVYLQVLLPAYLAGVFGFGFLTSYNKIIEVVSFDHREWRNQRGHVLRSAIPEGATVLTYCYLCFEMPWARSSAALHHERLRLSDFEYIVLTEEAPAVREQANPWFDSLTIAQSEELRKNFTQVAAMPHCYLPRDFQITSYRPYIIGIWIYRRNDVPIGFSRALTRTEE